MTHLNNDIRALEDNEIDEVNGGLFTLAVATLVVAAVGLAVAVFESGRSAGADAAERDNRADQT